MGGGYLLVDAPLCCLYKGEVGNAILNTKSKTGFPLFSVCNKYTGVS